ncbi:hypothetical protein M426DRAFT_90106 [Hypoxylon sp. CI-4A]|nr:hypothetical protein M426DRAFT_90106 [Hypoxylon sp. CI-4A]
MAQQYWHTNGIHGIIVRIGLRTLQFVFAVIAIALYAVNIQQQADTNTKNDAKTNWIYAEVVAGLSILTCVIHGFATVINTICSSL